ncbi:MAG: sulfotransferase [Ardenticatenaceae bacterium]|nr:MAG: sulfotransferase [Ardenticatenaceae bacterium]
MVDDPILIIGCQRSGTTLLTTILAQHPKLHTHPKELQIIDILAIEFGNSLPNTQHAIELVCSQKLCPANVTPEKLRQAVGSTKSCSLHHFIHAYLQTWRGNDDRRMVLKYPGFVFRLPLLDQLFPKATYVHMIRDPRANVSSQLARWPNSIIWEAANLWRDAVSKAHQWRQQHPNRTAELHYEQLVEQPETTLQTLCSQLNVPYSPKLLTFEMKTRRFTPGQSPEQARYSGLTSQRLHLWRERFSPVEIRLIEKVCAPLMTAYGYEPEQPPVEEAALRQARRQQKMKFAVLQYGRSLKNHGRHLKRLWRQRF